MSIILMDLLNITNILSLPQPTKPITDSDLYLMIVSWLLITLD